ncbi:DUF1189 domain-containing protein [Patescibacteria group bacterium]|nr:DUF1189 domain-containing protein [Patescibacteria group bacterium]MBU1970168.1 DUF1189 domain-containing protein [Patescibacteria group bacterium]
MKTFWHTFISSLARPNYYKTVLQAPLSKSTKYYSILSLLIILVVSVVDMLQIAPTIRHDFSKTAQEIVQQFPSDLVVNINPNGLSANQAFPLIAQTPSILKDWPRNLVVLDPQGQVGDMEKYDALILVNDSYIIAGGGTSIQTSPLSNFPATKIDAATIHRLTDTLSFIAQNAYSLTALFLVAAGLINSFVVRAVYLAVFNLGIWLSFKVVVHNYMGALKVSLHTLTLPVIINAALAITGLDLPIPAWFFFSHLVFTFYVLSRLVKPASKL